MRLGLWVAGPLLALLVLWQIATGLPPVECGEGGGASSRELDVFAIVTAVAILGAVVAAASRLVALWRRPSPRWPVASIALVVAPVLFAAAAIAFALDGVDALVSRGLILGALTTAAALLALLVAWALGRSVDRVGVLLPLYLLGAALICYPALLLLVLVDQSGFGC